MSLGKFPDLLLNISDADVKPAEIHSYRFKSFTLEPVERQLFDRDRRVSLSPKTFDVLTLLIVKAGHLVTIAQMSVPPLPVGRSLWNKMILPSADRLRIRSIYLLFMPGPRLTGIFQAALLFCRVATEMSSLP